MTSNSVRTTCLSMMAAAALALPTMAQAQTTMAPSGTAGGTGMSGMTASVPHTAGKMGPGTTGLSSNGAGMHRTGMGMSPSGVSGTGTSGAGVSDSEAAPAASAASRACWVARWASTRSVISWPKAMTWAGSPGSSTRRLYCCT